MLFSKDGKFLDVTDKAHIDCLMSKGWKVVTQNVKPTKKAIKKAVEETEE